MLCCTNTELTSRSALFCSCSSMGKNSWVVRGLKCPVVQSGQSLHTGYTSKVSLVRFFCDTARLLSWSAHNRLPQESTGWISHLQPVQVGSLMSLQNARFHREMYNWIRMITAIIYLKFWLVWTQKVGGGLYTFSFIYVSRIGIQQLHTLILKSSVLTTGKITTELK